MLMTSTANGSTPEFLGWSIEFTCPVRGLEDGRDPERIERQLRAARAVSDARREGRIFEGLCLDPPLGFRIDEALALYGGLAAVESACGQCPANAQRDENSLAGCYGVLPLWGDDAAVHSAVEHAIDAAGLADEVGRLFPATTPQWYGLWIASPVESPQRDVLIRLLTAFQADDPRLAAALADLIAGLRAAQAAKLPLHVRLYPRGRVEGAWWRLMPHCPRCRAAWPSERSRHCRVCGHSGHPAPDKKRRARGQRPYVPLDRLLSKEQAAAVVERLPVGRVS